MRMLKYFILGVLVMLNWCISLGQGDQLIVPTLVDNSDNVIPGGVVPKGGQFRIQVSFSFDKSHSGYSIKMELPANVDWSGKDFSIGDAPVSIDKNAISALPNNVYLIPVSVPVGIARSTHIYLDNLINNMENNCNAPVPSDIAFTLQAQGSTPLSYSNTCTLVTPVRGNITGSVTLELTQGQEMNGDNSNTGNFPYYVDVRVTEYNLSVSPVITLSYPSLLSFINAVYYNTATPPAFHKNILDAASVTQASNLLTINVHNTNPNGDFIRFYFRTTAAGQVSMNDIVLSATGAKYQKCDGSEEPAVVAPKTIPAGFATVPSAASLLPGFQYKNSQLYFCPQNCNFNVSGYDAEFYFEINDIYTQFGATVPRVRVECPSSVAKIKSLSFTTSQYTSGVPVIRYLVANSTTEQSITPVNGVVDFGTANPQVIFIDSFALSGASYTAKDFVIKYASTLPDLSTTAPALKVFNLKYENYTNTRVYTSEAMTIGYNCSPGMRLEDEYERDDESFGTGVTYSPGAHTDIRLKIRPNNIYYSSTYKISGAIYTLDNNMMLDPDNSTILYSETGQPGSFRPLVSDLTYYKNLNIRLDKAQNALVINNLDLDNTMDCGTQKNLYLIIGVVIKTKTSYASSSYHASLSYSGSTNHFTDYYPSYWNIIRSSTDLVSDEIKILCPGDGQEMGEFGNGQTVTVQYIINNDNQNPVSNLSLKLLQKPGLILPCSDVISCISIRSRNFPSQNWNSGLAVQPDGGDLKLDLNNTMNGNDKLYINVSYSLDQALGVNSAISGIDFKIISYTSSNGAGGAGLPLTGGKSIRIVSDPVCIPRPPCHNCVTSFSPVPGQEYLLSAWIKESYSNDSVPTPKKYEHTGIQITFNDGDVADLPLFSPAGPVIDGWQRVEASFVVPANAFNIQIEMVNNGDNDAFFDDIRIHPFRSNMKSFVYDPSTQRLVAELDENNYATLYEYDDEGILVRVKKETERGVMTIKESRNNQSKIK